MHLPLPPLAAADWPQFVIGLIVIIAYIVKLAVQAGKGAIEISPPPPPRKPVPSELKKEIDIFLQDVSPRKTTMESNPPRPRKATSRDSERPAAPKAKEAKRRSLGQEATDRAAAETRSRHSIPGSEIENRKKPGRENLGAEIRQHVSQHLDSNSLSQRVQQDLPNRLQQSVTEHLGEASSRLKATALPTLSSSTVNASALQLLELLRQPGQVRQAMMVNEILSRPVSLRRRREGQ
jgi:hypothetical protein